MSHFIDEAAWREALGEVDWYVRLADDWERLQQIAQKHQTEPDHKEIKRQAYRLVEAALQAGDIPLATAGKDFDQERRPIDTIVIHHTKNPPGMTLERLNAMHLLNIYGRYFANPANPEEHHLKGQPVWSGHFYQGRQVFWGYHWLVREAGQAEHILADEYIGWHAGNWDINTRSIGICIDDDLSHKTPSQAVIASVAKLIRQHYPAVEPTNVIGHCDANKATECPGNPFHQSWRQKLLEQL